MTEWMMITATLFLVGCVLTGMVALSMIALDFFTDKRPVLGLLTAIVALLIFSGGFGLLITMLGHDSHKPLCLRGHEEYQQHHTNRGVTYARAWVCDERAAE
jgi:hypothetical protein